MSQATSIVHEGSPSSSSQLDTEPPGRRFVFGMLAKTTLAMVVVGLVPLVVFGLFTLWQQNTRLRADAELAMQSTAETVSSQVDEWIDKNVRVLQAAANLGAITSMSRDEQTKILTAIRQAYPWMFLVFTANRDGKNIARSDTLPLADFSDRKYFSDVVARGQDLSWETLIGKASGKPTLVIAVPIKVNGATVGILAASMVIEEISRIVATWKAGSTGYAFLVDESTKVVAHPKTQYVNVQRRLTDHPMVTAFGKDGTAHVQHFTEDNTEVLGAVHGTRMHWAVVVQQNSAELFAPLQQTLRLGIGLLIGAIVLVGLFAMGLSRILVRPIVFMTRAADQMSLGQLSAPITSTSGDELGQLAQSLERLRKSMVLAMKRLDSQ